MEGSTLTTAERDLALAGMVGRSVRLGASPGEAVRAVARDNRLTSFDVMASLARARMEDVASDTCEEVA
jgi:hypothetical protein